MKPRHQLALTSRHRHMLILCFLPMKFCTSLILRVRLAFTSRQAVCVFSLCLRRLHQFTSTSFETKKAAGTEIVKLWNAAKPLYFSASSKFLQRILSQYESEILDKHSRKLRPLYGDEIFHSQPSSNNVNLSSHVLSDPESRSYLVKA